jgi:HK97 family phage major capsid protein
MTLIERLRSTRADLFAQVDAVIAAADAESRDLTDEELAQVTDLRERLDGVDERLAELAEVESRRERAATADASPGANTERATAAVTNEPRTYRRGGPDSFFSDAFRAVRLGDARAASRLAQHATEVEIESERVRNAEGIEQRDLGTGSFGGLVVPQYLVDEFADVLRNGRAVANAVRREPLPAQGMTLIVPRAETGTAVAAQDGQNVAVQETDADFDNDLTINVRTFAGQQDVSRQALERGTPGLDTLVYADLVADYAMKLDASVIAGTGGNGTHVGLQAATGENVVTYTDATPTLAEFWPKLADAIQQVASNRKVSASLIAMHPRRWGWVIAAVDSTGRPLIVHGDAGAAINAMGKAAGAFGEGQLVGTLMGLPVIVDGNIPTDVGTNEDVVFVLKRDDPILWEEGDGLPRQLRFEEVGAATLTVKLLVYGYSAFTADRRPTGLSRITGTGLIAPTF